MAVGRDPIWRDAGHRLGGAEERLGGCHVAVFTEQHVDQVSVPVDGAIEIAPAPVHFQVCLIDVQPILAAIELIAADWEACSPW